MANVTIVIPDELVAPLVNVTCAVFEYDTNKVAGETRAQFARRMMPEVLLGWGREQRRRLRRAALETQPDPDWPDPGAEPGG